MNPMRKSARCTFKALKSPGEFEAEFSVYGNVDLDGDRIRKGALAPALDKNPNPAIVWTHMWDIPPIGETLEATDGDTGGKAVGRLFLDDHQTAREVWAGLKSGALTQYSFAFNIGEQELVEAKGEETPRKDGRIRDIAVISDLFEWGPTLVGANPMTSTIGLAKTARLHALSKGYDDVDGWGIYCLTAMIGYGVDFIENEDDDNDIASMRGILSSIMGLLSAEMAEDGIDGGDVFASAMRTLLAERKAGARHSAEDLTMIQAIHDLSLSLGATSPYGDGTPADDGGEPIVMSHKPDTAKVAELLAARPMLHLHS